MNTETALKALKILSELRVCPFHFLDHSEELVGEIKAMIKQLKEDKVIDENNAIFLCDAVCGEEKDTKECFKNAWKLALITSYGTEGDKRGGAEDFWDLWKTWEERCASDVVKDYAHEIRDELDQLFKKHGVYETKVTEA